MNEHRQHPRIFFSEADKVSAKLAHMDSDHDDFPAIIMNISVGGVGISTRSRFSGPLSEGQRLMIQFIKVDGSTSAIRGLTARVQWVIEDDTTDKLVVGLEFRGLDTLSEGVIQRFIDGRKTAS